ncbi:hypothetical protein DPMN_086872 [Dreissena polymorpha]|uniref:Uncharacterized protein n=1 Tax=Dreissena polymorpha TaxID=45954 RepID=A0A9D4KR76_DREPO|nr:hypothetical protein DPMN_086872 [Dreissena polymorpha]
MVCTMVMAVQLTGSTGETESIKKIGLVHEVVKVTEWTQETELAQRPGPDCSGGSGPADWFELGR